MNGGKQTKRTFKVNCLVGILLRVAWYVNDDVLERVLEYWDPVVL